MISRCRCVPHASERVLNGILRIVGRGHDAYRCERKPVSLVGKIFELPWYSFACEDSGRIIVHPLVLRMSLVSPRGTNRPNLIVGEKGLGGTLRIQGYARAHDLESWFAPVPIQQHPDHVRGDQKREAAT